MPVCTNCNQELPQGAKFCLQCGTPIQSEPKKIVCAKCGKELPEDAKFCLQCGTPVPAKQNICANCGKELPQDAKFCFACGTASTAAKSAPPQPSAPPQQAAPLPQAAPPPKKGPPPIPAALVIPKNFIRINGGTFTMGSPDGGINYKGDLIQDKNEVPPHKVTISQFYMCKYPITQREYKELMGNNPSEFNGDILPVENVSWYDAVEYCNKRSEKEGISPAYSIEKDEIDHNNRNSFDNMKWTVTWNRDAAGYRLPTEAEWEYACRAGTTTPFNTGIDINTEQANFDGNINREKTTPIGTFPANPWGLFDMHGNVYEWCWDWFGDYKAAAQIDPAGAESGELRVLRGGSWKFYFGDVRSARRYAFTPSISKIYLSDGSVTHKGFIGFRLVRSV